MIVGVCGVLSFVNAIMADVEEMANGSMLLLLLVDAGVADVVGVCSMVVCVVIGVSTVDVSVLDGLGRV